jgi:4-cresol dehydrogenase (hydroxylating)
MSEASFSAFVASLTDALGPEAVTTDPASLREFRDPFAYRGDDRRDYSAVVSPVTTKEVQAVVGIARAFGVPLWTISQGRNNTYGGPAPRVRGSALVSLRNMNRILEINRELAYVVVEPGVRWSDLADALAADGGHLWASVPDFGWGSVIGNSLDSGIGYAPRGDHAANLAGLEVVLPDGSLLRTGFGAHPGNPAWHAAPRGFGPSVDGLFLQSNFGIVTRAGYLVNRAPQAYAACQFDFRGYDALVDVIDVLRDLMLTGVVTNYPTLFRGVEVAGGELVMTPGSDGWAGRCAFYGSRERVETDIATARARLGTEAGTDLEARVFAGDDLAGPSNHDQRVQRGIPAVQLGDPEKLPFGPNFAHLDHAVVLPQLGTAVAAAERLITAHYAAREFPLTGGILLRGRSVLVISSTFFDVSDEAMTASAYDSYTDLVEAFAARGILPYRTNLDNMDAVAGHLSFGDGALPRFLTTLKDALDPVGIIQPGKSGIWPSALRPCPSRSRLAVHHLAVHHLAKALGPQVGPVLVDPREALSASARRAGRRPPVRDLVKGRPQRVLLLAVDKHEEFAGLVVKWVRHGKPHSPLVSMPCY